MSKCIGTPATDGLPPSHPPTAPGFLTSPALLLVTQLLKSTKCHLLLAWDHPIWKALASCPERSQRPKIPSATQTWGLLPVSYKGLEHLNALVSEGTPGASPWDTEGCQNLPLHNTTTSSWALGLRKAAQPKPPGKAVCCSL